MDDKRSRPNVSPRILRAQGLSDANLAPVCGPAVEPDDKSSSARAYYEKSAPRRHQHRSGGNRMLVTH
ncbi:Hypothetical protein NTJ_09729 [Nesidiocoris tenuis]|uniref:Uncharacterized protein n=1 Tax=Nesidiocoris tenuis TaxID=355587 RepID=A0ABN7B184_9HEMI|nr:Hypothetical protein NTJ_09729 [Nesidiocoris tenuis]